MVRKPCCNVALARERTSHIPMRYYACGRYWCSKESVTSIPNRSVIRVDHRHCDIFHLVGIDVEHAVTRVTSESQDSPYKKPQIAPYVMKNVFNPWD